MLATEIVDAVFASPQQHSSLEVLVAIYAYAVQIYADFSGYTDMAIGLALLLGFRFPQNFDSPYTARSIQDFWRRWHMTLSRWLRDYLYIPLGGNRSGSRRDVRNLMLTMLLGGLWHGAAWTFVVWGAIHGFYLSLEHWRRARRERLGLPEPADTEAASVDAAASSRSTSCASPGSSSGAESLENAFEMLGRLIDPSHWFDASPLVTVGVLVAIAVGLAEQYIPRRTMEPRHGALLVPRTGAAGCGARARAHAHQHDGAERRRALHLLQVLTGIRHGDDRPTRQRAARR